LNKIIISVDSCAWFFSRNFIFTESKIFWMRGSSYPWRNDLITYCKGGSNVDCCITWEIIMVCPTSLIIDVIESIAWYFNYVSSRNNSFCVEAILYFIHRIIPAVLRISITSFRKASLSWLFCSFFWSHHSIFLILSRGFSPCHFFLHTNTSFKKSVIWNEKKIKNRLYCNEQS